MGEQAVWQKPIREGCYLVGHRNPDTLLQCNTYLRTFVNGSGPVHWCIDPGSQIDYPHVRDHLLAHVGDLRALRLFSVNHQDPDVVGNLTYLTEANDRLVGLATQDVWRLVRHLVVKPRNLYFADQAHNGVVRLPTGQQIRAVPTPFCHFRGAMAFYDPESRILFSGDLFGGLNAPGRVGRDGDLTDWIGIAQFHQIYMPARTALAYAVAQIRALRPAVEVIAPQHGFVLTGEVMHTFLDRLEQLPVGLDLLPLGADDRSHASYRDLIARFVEAVARHLSRSEILGRLRALPEQHELRQHLTAQAMDVELTGRGDRALPLVVAELTADLPPLTRGALKSWVLDECSRLGLPLPQIGIGVEEIGSPEPLS
ncbi:MAG: hypothetical protein U0736_07600 [Gemmataceae bacterium]